MYSLPDVKRAFAIFVAFPSMTGSTPVTWGSNVPECPARFNPKMRLTHETTSWLVGPGGFSGFGKELSALQQAIQIDDTIPKQFRNGSLLGNTTIGGIRGVLRTGD